MNDEELAIKVYQILKGRPPAKHKCGNHTWNVYTWGLTAKPYVRDWRVAGAVIEYGLDDYKGRAILCDSLEYVETVLGDVFDENHSLPRAIIEYIIEDYVDE